MRRNVVVAVLVLVAALPASFPGAMSAHAATAPAGGDITALITANGGRDDIVLKGGDYQITIPSTGPKVQEDRLLPAVPETIYHGVISGTGTITVKPPPGGRAALVMTGLSTFSLPPSRRRTWSNKQPFATYQYDGAKLNGGKSPWDVDVLHGRTNDPVLTIARGAIVHLNDLDGQRAYIESYVGAGGKGAGAYNHDSIRVDGTLVFTNNHHSPYETTIGPLSGTGDFLNHVGGFRMSGDSTISGSVVMHGANVNGAWAFGKFTGVSKIYNDLDLAYGATPKTIGPAGNSSPGVQVVSQTIYECCYGNAVYNIGAGEMRFTGKYSYSDSQDELHPGLSNPKLNYTAFPKGNSQRVLDLGQGITTLGDGTDADFWLPSGWGNAYIGTHGAYALGFDYNGPVRMNVPINRATDIDRVNLFIKGTPGNRVIVTQPLLYHGFTQIDAKAVLAIGDGTKGNKKSYTFYNKQIQGMDTGIYSTSAGSGLILTADTAPGGPGDRIIDNGTLVVANAKGALSGIGALSLSDISGRGSLEQRGPAPLTLLSHISYRGATTVKAGRLVLARSRRGSASLNQSSGVKLTGKTAELDLTRVAPQNLKSLASVAGSRVRLGSRALFLKQGTDTTFAGTLSGSTGSGSAGSGTGFTKDGAGTFTLEGRVSLGKRALGIKGGSVVLQGTVDGPVLVGPNGTLRAVRGTAASLSTAGHAELAGPLTLKGGLTQAATGTLQGLPGGSLKTLGPVTLAGALTVGGASRKAATTLIDNTGSAPVKGTFSGLAEGDQLSVGSQKLTISYRGGDGNDVVLTPGGGGAAAGVAALGGLAGGLLGDDGPSGKVVAGSLLAAAAVLGGGFLFALRRRRRDPEPSFDEVTETLV